MSNAKRILTAAVVLTAFVTTTFAATNVVGTWTGRIILDMSKMPKPTNPQQQQTMKKMMDQLAKMRITLKLKANKSFSVSAPAGPGGKPQTGEGTWTQSGQTVTITVKTENGKPATGQSAQPQALSLSKDGKTMTLVPPTAQGGGKVVFKRA